MTRPDYDYRTASPAQLHDLERDGWEAYREKTTLVSQRLGPNYTRVVEVVAYYLRRPKLSK